MNRTHSEKCIVDVDNIFVFENYKYRISEEVENYHVDRRYDEVDNYENDARMDLIIVVVYEDGDKDFFDQYGFMIDEGLVQKLRKVV